MRRSGNMSQATVVVWSKSGCSYCQEVKGFLEENQISYKEVDVTSHDDRRDILELKYDVRYVPVVEIGQEGNYTGVTQLGLEALKAALEKQGIL